jgi:hypothetical protein
VISLVFKHYKECLHCLVQRGGFAALFRDDDEVMMMMIALSLSLCVLLLLCFVVAVVV